LGIQTDIRVQLYLPALVPHAQFDEHTSRSLNRPKEHPRRFHGVGIEFLF
jgi:hypothetical protein